jgi:hypothetical protein
MAADIDAGRVAFALAQTTLSMLVTTGVLDSEIVHATANKLESSESLDMSENEIVTLAGAMRSSTAS